MAPRRTPKLAPHSSGTGKRPTVILAGGSVQRERGIGPHHGWLGGGSGYRQQILSSVPLLTHIGGYCPVHDIQGFVKLVLDGRVGQHLVREHGFPAQVPLGDLLIVGAVAEPGAQHLPSGNSTKLGGPEELRSRPAHCQRWFNSRHCIQYPEPRVTSVHL